MSTKTRMMSLIMPAMAREVEDEEGHEAEAEEKVVDVVGVAVRKQS